MSNYWSLAMFTAVLLSITCEAQNMRAQPAGISALNPVIWADIPDMSVNRIGDTYYMSSTTMHLNPHVPIMKSKDLINWEIVSYVLETMESIDELNLSAGKNDYGRGAWASSLRFRNGTWYISTFSHTTGKTYIGSTNDIENGPWKTISFSPCFHDNTLFFDDDGRVYIIYGAGSLKLVELNADVSGVKSGTTETVIIENASSPAGEDIMLPAEGSQLFKINGIYYLLNITWPQNGMRTVIIHRAEKITGPWEGKIALQDKGIAQGGLVDTPDGRWFAYLFRDFGAVGRIPYLVPVRWESGWPVLGINGNVPDNLSLPPSNGVIPGIVATDDFRRKRDEPPLPRVWQWNHNPANMLWSVTRRNGWLRLTTDRVDTVFTQARNTLTQRTFGPRCAGATLIDISGMRDGDFAGLALFQKKFGQVGVMRSNGVASVVMVNADTGNPVVMESVPVHRKKIYLRAECDFTDQTDAGNFFYSLDGKTWIAIGTPLKMEYTIPHFMGYRFGLFFYSISNPGGSADFDWFRISPGRDLQ